MPTVPQLNVEMMAAIAIRYELHSLEEFVRDQCSPLQMAEPGTPGRIKRWEQFVDGEIRKIRRNMTSQVISISKAAPITLYIQHHQAGIIQLSCLLTQYEKDGTISRHKAGHEFYHNIQYRLWELLDFLKHYFENHFDWHQPLPDFVQFGFIKETFKGYLELLPVSEDDEFKRVIEIISETWRAIKDGTYKVLTFYQEHYFAVMVKAMEEDLGKDSKATDLLQLLMQLNYNDTRFMDYWRLEFIRLLDEAGDGEGQLRFLAERIKQLKQMPLQKAGPFNPANPNLVSYCRHWMEEELQFLQAQGSRAGMPGHADSSFIAPLKIRTRLTVDQLGMLLQLLHRVRIINHKNQTAFLSFFADHFITENKAAISAKSLRNSYYNLDPKSSEAIKELLYQMLKELRELE